MMELGKPQEEKAISQTYSSDRTDLNDCTLPLDKQW